MTLKPRLMKSLLCGVRRLSDVIKKRITAIKRVAHRRGVQVVEYRVSGCVELYILNSRIEDQCKMRLEIIEALQSLGAQRVLILLHNARKDAVEVVLNCSM